MSTGLVSLNLLDCNMLLMERLLNSRGVSGFQGSVLLLFQGRIDLGQLQESANRLAARWPLVTARLTCQPTYAWKLSGRATLPIREISLESDSLECVEQTSRKLKAESFDVENQDPLRLVLMHRPGGDDVLSVHISHVLFDAHAGLNMVKQLLDPSQIPPLDDDEVTPIDPLATAIASHSFRARMKALRSAYRYWRHTAPVTFPGLAKQPWPKRPQVGGTILRWLDEETTATLEARMASLGAFCNLNLAAAASGFRTLRRFAGDPRKPNSIYELILPYDLRRGRQKRIPYHNIFQRMLLTAQPQQLDDRDRLVQELATQFRNQIRNDDSGMFLGQAQMARIAVKLSQLAPWLLKFLKPRRSRSLRVGFSDDLYGHGRTYLGATFEGFFVTSVCCAPLGASLDLFKIGKRLLLVFMHSPEALSAQQAEQFFADWVDDLCAA